MRVMLRSKLIDSAEYDPESFRLVLFMSNGQIREFGQVPPSVIEELRTASSPGTYYLKLIRERYPHLS